jgi:hypothetical protein
MDWKERGPWKIEDLEGNSLVVNDDLEMAYFKATSLIYDLTCRLREISSDEFEIVVGDGTVVNTIRRP